MLNGRGGRSGERRRRSRRRNLRANKEDASVVWRISVVRLPWAKRHLTNKIYLEVCEVVVGPDATGTPTRDAIMCFIGLRVDSGVASVVNLE